MKLNLSGVHLDERDLKLFPYLFAVKVATYEQIHRDIYSGITLDAAGYRLRKIEDNGLIKIDRSRLILRGKRTVSLRKKGFDIFVKSGEEKRTEISSDAIIHDLTLGDMRYRFKSLGKVVRYQTENEIQTWGNDERKLNSDAIATVLLGENAFAVPVEYERTLKEKKRCMALVKQYYKEAEIPLVFLIADVPTTIESLQRSEKSIFPSDKPKFFYTLKQSFLEDEFPILTNYRGANLNLMQSTPDR